MTGRELDHQTLFMRHLLAGSRVTESVEALCISTMVSHHGISRRRPEISACNRQTPLPRQYWKLRSRASDSGVVKAESGAGTSV